MKGLEILIHLVTRSGVMQLSSWIMKAVRLQACGAETVVGIVVSRISGKIIDAAFDA